MWLSGILACSAVALLVAVAFDPGPISIGGMAVTREFWLEVAAPLTGAIAVFSALTTIGLRRHRPWSRWSCMCIWPLIVATAIAAAMQDAIPSWIVRQAVIDAGVAAAIAAWLLFRYRESVLYFYRVRQARGGSLFRR